MNDSTGDESRQSLEAKLDRILREPVTVSDSAKTQPVLTPIVQPMAEEKEVSRRADSKTFSDYVRPAIEGVLSSLKSSRKWLMTVVGSARKLNFKNSWSRFGKWIPKFGKLSGRRVNKRLAFVLGGIGVTLAVLLTVLMNLSYLTVSNGIETTLGTSENRTVLTLKSSEANQGDLIVASLGLDNETNEEILVVGTVFSKNDQTYALYDGEVIWQITAEQIRGKVLFAEATETP
jgi:hypothetical protein